MKEKLIKEVKLENHHTVEILDISRKISVDAYLVAMVARMPVPVDKSLFSHEELSINPFDDIIKKLGTQVVFEYTNQRNFIMADNKDSVLQELVDTFLDNMAGYLSKESFPRKFILKKYRE